MQVISLIISIVTPILKGNIKEKADAYSSLPKKLIMLEENKDNIQKKTEDEVNKALSIAKLVN